MDFRQLRSFIAICETGSISRAAQSLRIAQPALGLQIRKLEDELGTMLLHRSSRGVKPTEAGAVLLAEAEAILARTKLAAARVRDVEGDIRGQVILGTTPSVSAMLAGKVVRRCTDKLPGVSLVLVENLGANLLDMLYRDRVDICFAHRAGSPTGLRLEELSVEELFLVERRAVAVPDPFPVGQLGSLDLILPSDKHALRQLVEHHALAAGTSLHVKVEVQNASSTMCELVEQGIGNTILPFGLVKDNIARGTLAVRPFSPKIVRTMFLATPGTRAQTRAEAGVCEIIRTLVRELISAGTMGWRLPG